MGEHDLRPEEVHPDAGRRKLLKAVAAAGGAAAATLLLPGSWVKPVVELGVLPAGAQAAGSDVRVILDTQTLQLVAPNGTNWALDARNAACDTTPRFVTCGSDGYRAECNYTDPLGEFDPLNWTLFTRETPCNIVRSRLICGGDGGFYIFGDVYCGSFYFYKVRECNSSTGLWWWVKKGSRTSNEVFAARPADPE